MSKFYNDLKTGQKYERLLLNHIKYKNYEIMNGYYPDYDVMVYKNNGGKSSYEVKSDKQINIYNNICIEYECKNKPSGISTSKAKYWAIFEPKGDKYRLYKIPSKVLRDMIDNGMYDRDVRGGDYYASRLYLFNKELFNEYIIFSNI